MSQELKKLAHTKKLLVAALRRGDYAKGTIPSYKEAPDPYGMMVPYDTIDLPPEVATKLRSDLLDLLLVVQTRIMEETLKQVRLDGE